MTEDEMVGWHHQLNGLEFEQAPRVGDGQGGLACCGSWGHKESDTTEWLNRLTESSSGFPYFLQFKSEFGNKEFMVCATVSSRSCFCWLYRTSPSFGCKEYNQSDFSIDQLVMSMCRVFSCVVGRGWPVCSLVKTLLVFALLHSLLQGQICLLLQGFLDFLLFHSTPL